MTELVLPKLRMLQMFQEDLCFTASKVKRICSKVWETCSSSITCSSSSEGSQSKYSISETPLRDFIVEQLCAIKNRMYSLSQINKGEAKYFSYFINVFL